MRGSGHHSLQYWRCGVFSCIPLDLHLVQRPRRQEPRSDNHVARICSCAAGKGIGFALSNITPAQAVASHMTRAVSATAVNFGRFNELGNPPTAPLSAVAGAHALDLLALTTLASNTADCDDVTGRRNAEPGAKIERGTSNNSLQNNISSNLKFDESTYDFNAVKEKIELYDFGDGCRS